MEPIAALSSFVVIGLVIIVLLVHLWLPAMRDDAAPLEQVLRRQGDGVAARALPRRDYAAALQRCASCPEAQQCRAWIRTGDREAYRYFCPSTAFIDRMKRVV
jgi:hypothetical protein